MTDDRQPTLKASFMGTAFAAKGLEGIVMLVMIALAVGGGWLIYDKSSEDRKVLTAIAEMLNAHATSMKEDHKVLNKGVEALVETGSSTARQLKMQNYIILADPQEKAEVKKKLGRPIELQ